MYFTRVLLLLSGVMVIREAPLDSKYWWVSWIIGPVFIGIGLYLIEKYFEMTEVNHYHWKCEVCSNKGQRFVCRASNQQLLDTMRTHHMRQVHLLEP